MSNTNPYTPPKSKLEEVESIRTSHKIYSLFSIGGGIFYLFGISFLIIRKLIADTDNQLEYIAYSMCIAASLLMLIGCSITLKKKSFKGVGAWMSIIGNILTIWLIPLGVFGLILTLKGKKK